MSKEEMLKALIQSEHEIGLVHTLNKYYGSDIKVAVGFTSAACARSIDEINFSVRSHNALKRAGLFTVGDVIDALSEGELMKIRNLGRKSLAEIKTRILVCGFDQLSETEQKDFFQRLIEDNNPNF